MQGIRLVYNLYMTKRRAGYRNLNRAKSGKAEQLSVGWARGQSNPTVQGYAPSAVFTDVEFRVRVKTVARIYRRQEKEVCAFFVGDFEETSIVRYEGKYAIYTANPNAVPVGREVTIAPKHDSPSRRVFHYVDTLEPLDLSRRYRVIWTIENRCYVS